MNQTPLERIRSRGYWEIVIRPATFEAGLVPYNRLEPIVEMSRVQLRGWDFPHRWKGNLQRGQDWVQDGGTWMNYLEQWRFHQSGLFVYYAAQRLDWIELADHLGTWKHQYMHVEPGQQLGAIEVLHRFTDLYEFAARLALTEEFIAIEQVHIDITIAGLENRSLRFEDPRWMPGLLPPHVSMPEYTAHYAYPRQTLIGTARDLSLIGAGEFFVRFAYEPSMQTLRTMADQR